LAPFVQPAAHFEAARSVKARNSYNAIYLVKEMAMTPEQARTLLIDPQTHLARCLGWLIQSDRYCPSRGARVRKRHGPPLAVDAVAKAPFVPLIPTIRPVTNWANLAQFPRWI
jgi:hypothetical protein